MPYTCNLFAFAKILQYWYRNFYLTDGDHRAQMKRSAFVVVVDSRLVINSRVSDSRAGVQFPYYWGGRNRPWLCCKFNVQWKTKLFWSRGDLSEASEILPHNGCLLEWVPMQMENLNNTENFFKLHPPPTPHSLPPAGPWVISLRTTVLRGVKTQSKVGNTKQVSS